MFSPLEQFEVFALIPIYFQTSQYNIDLSITNVSLFLALAFLSYIILMQQGLSKAGFMPTRPQIILEELYWFVVNLIKQQSGTQGLRYFPLFFSIFMLILTSNLIGLFSFSTTPTSHLVFTFTLALMCNLTFIFIGFKENSWKFLKLFKPKGGPLWLFPVIIIIELMSYLLRTFSLSIRLFANMMAGHALLHILSGFVTTFVLIGSLSGAFVVALLVLAIMALEFFIAFIQAYVFLVLLCIYLNESFHPEH